MSVALDVFWQFGCQEPLSRRRIMRIMCKIRNAGSDACGRHDVLYKKNNQPRRERRTIVARGRDERREVKQQLDEMAQESGFESSCAFSEERDDYGEYEAERLAGDLVELDADAQERAIMFGIEANFRHRRERVSDIHARIRFLRDFTLFLEAQADRGSTDDALLEECTLELYELELLTYIAA